MNWEIINLWLTVFTACNMFFSMMLNILNKKYWWALLYMTLLSAALTWVLVSLP